MTVRMMYRHAFVEHFIGTLYSANGYGQQLHTLGVLTPPARPAKSGQAPDHSTDVQTSFTSLGRVP